MEWRVAVEDAFGADAHAGARLDFFLPHGARQQVATCEIVHWINVFNGRFALLLHLLSLFFVFSHRDEINNEEKEKKLRRKEKKKRKGLEKFTVEKLMGVDGSDR
jgi:hypothetical protein